MTTFVIVGGGLAGAKAAETLRAEGFDGEVVLFGDEAERPYERPALAKGYLLGKDERDSVFVHAGPWYPEHHVDLRDQFRHLEAQLLDMGRHEMDHALEPQRQVAQRRRCADRQWLEEITRQFHAGIESSLQLTVG